MKRKVFLFLIDLVAYFSAALVVGLAYGSWWGVGAAGLVLSYGLICYMDGANS